jgi:LytS/YehU family sensor histidine kinase
MKQVQLRSLRNQLNPHFLFNSLSAIQNLINRNDIKSANHYLSQFAGLTRTVLDTSEEELISLEDELKMLHAYLQMEQLRFPFQYSITVDEQINKANTEIPAMLIQPFAENAVKHGVASLKEEGMISIFIHSNNKSLVITIQDNGRGFNAGQPVNGNGSMGLKLSRERIRLLNEMYGADSVELKIEADTTGTMININLKDWLS